jgi:alpha-L-rhamnosidase
LKNQVRNELLSRRRFLGRSVAATVASIGLPGNPAVYAADHTGRENATRESFIAFRSAQRIWPEGREKQMNLSVGFRAGFDAPSGKHVHLRVAGCTFYRLYLNGRFHAWGPARGPKDHFRVDLWDITPLLMNGRNFVCAEVAGYNVNSYYVLDQPSFLQAEVATDSEVLASTGGEGERFEAQILTERVQKVQRYTFQRTFSEIYHLDQQSSAWRERPEAAMQTVTCAVFPPAHYVDRGVPYPNYAKRQPEMMAAEGEFKWGVKAPKSLYEDRSIPSAARIGPNMLGYAWSDLTEIPYLELQRTENTVNKRVDGPYVCDSPIRLKANEFKTLDFGTDLPGFFGAHVTAHAPTKLYFTFDETLTGGDRGF